MPRPRKTDRPVRREIYLPESLDTRVALLLWSPAENRIPHGAYSLFVESLIRRALDGIAATQKEPAHAIR